MLKRNLIVLTLLAAVLTSVAAPSVTAVPVRAQTVTQSVTHTHTAAFDKTRFLLHLGAAYFVFHHWVYKPYKDGSFTQKSRFHRYAAYIKAGLALLFAYHEVKTAYGIAKSSNSKLLHAIIAPMNALASSFDAVGNKLKHLHYSSSDVTSLNSQANGFQSLAGKNGFPIKDNSNVSFH